MTTKPYCGLCNEPKFEIRHKQPTGIFLCNHCDVPYTFCKGLTANCGACVLAREKTTYEGLVWGNATTQLSALDAESKPPFDQRDESP